MPQKADDARRFGSRYTSKGTPDGLELGRESVCQQPQDIQHFRPKFSAQRQGKPHIFTRTCLRIEIAQQAFALWRRRKKRQGAEGASNTVKQSFCFLRILCVSATSASVPERPGADRHFKIGSKQFDVNAHQDMWLRSR